MVSLHAPCPVVVRLLNHPDRRSIQRIHPLRSERQVMVRQSQDQPQGPLARRVDPETAQEVSRSIRYTRGQLRRGCGEAAKVSRVGLLQGVSRAGSGLGYLRRHHPLSLSLPETLTTW